MDLFSPLLVRTFFPGLSLVPDVDLDMFLIGKSSIHTIVWLWLMAVLTLCRQSFLMSAIRLWIFRTFNRAFCQLLLDFSFRLFACCALRIAKAITDSLALESGKVRSFGKKVSVRRFQVFQALLEYLGLWLSFNHSNSRFHSGSRLAKWGS